MLFGLNPLDGVAMATAATVLTAVAIAAAYLPARHAASLDPVESLKRM
jgi:ABC-type antimicrobial peptide transport system permease subunit